MELHDYVSPEPDILRDDYEPRPKASQHVAAFHRAKASRPTHDTEPIQPIALPSPTRTYVPFGIGALVLIVLMIGAATYQLRHIESSKPLQITPQATDAPTDAPAAAVSAPAPTSQPQTSRWQPPADPPAAAEPDKGQKAADDRAARHAAAVARDQQQPQHGSK
jgi:hypothetical protein